MKTDKKYAFIGLGDDAIESFSEEFDSVQETIEAAKFYWERGDDDYFGYKLDENGNQTEERCPLIEILATEGFDYDDTIECTAEDLMCAINDNYWDFESGIDDGDFRFKPGFKDEYKKLVKELVEKYGYATGITRRGDVLYHYDIEKGEITNEE